MVSRGNKVEFNGLQLRVLRCLAEDARMSATDIADKTGLTPRRVRRIITQLQNGGGLSFATRLNLNAGPGIMHYAQICWDETKADHLQVESWLRSEFPDVYFDSHTSASAPMMLSIFVVDQIRDAESVSRRISQEPMITSVNTIFPYPTKKGARLQRTKLESLLQKADI
jgi:DNA-binding Lrp family transcriptional regulator